MKKKEVEKEEESVKRREKKSNLNLRKMNPARPPPA